MKDIFFSIMTGDFKKLIKTVGTCIGSENLKKEFELVEASYEIMTLNRNTFEELANNYRDAN